MSGIVVSCRGGKRARKMLDSLSGRELQNRVRRGSRRGAGIFRKEVRARAGSGGIPRRFKKTLTRGHRTPVGTSTGPSSPLLNIFEKGAGTHEIAPGKLAVTGDRPMLLSGPAGKDGRTRAFLASMPVRHPGMKARPLIAPVFTSKNEAASEAAMDEILRGLR